MNFNYLKRTLAIVTVCAVSFGTVAMMATSVGASAFRKPTYDRIAAGWRVNDFRRDEAKNFPNSVAIYPFGVTSDDLSKADHIHLIMPEGVEYKDIAGVRAAFDFGNVSEDDLAEMDNMAVIAQHEKNTWEQHNLHVQADAKQICGRPPEHLDGTGITCGQKCKYDKNMVATVNFNTNLRETDWLRITLTCDWAEEGANTKGSATVQLIDKKGKPIQLSVWCASKCKGPCVCPCKCGQVKLGPCKCPCGTCKKFPCECICDTCKKGPCVCPCADCKKPKADCVCFEAPDTSEGDDDDDDEEGGTGNQGTGNRRCICVICEGCYDGCLVYNCKCDDCPDECDCEYNVGGSDVNPPAGVALAFIPTLLAAGAAVITKKRNK